jgi:hypothetical protein
MMHPDNEMYDQGFEAGVAAAACQIRDLKAAIESEGVRRIANERGKHHGKGYTPEHDAVNHDDGQLASRAAELAMHTVNPASPRGVCGYDSWDLIEDHGDDLIRCLEIAGSLIAAEIDRRLAEKGGRS